MTLTTGQSKDMTITVDPTNATDAANVIDAVTAVSSDDSVGTVAAKTDVKGIYTITGVKAGNVTVTFTSGNFNTVLTVTVNDAAESTE